MIYSGIRLSFAALLLIMNNHQNLQKSVESMHYVVQDRAKGNKPELAQSSSTLSNTSASFVGLMFTAFLQEVVKKSLKVQS